MKNITKKLLLIVLSVNTGFVVGLSAILGIFFLLEYSGMKTNISGMTLGHIGFYAIKVLCIVFGVLTYLYLSKQAFVIDPNVGLMSLFSNRLRIYSIFTIASTALFIWGTSDTNHSYIGMLYQIIVDWQDSALPYSP